MQMSVGPTFSGLKSFVDIVSRNGENVWDEMDADWLVAKQGWLSPPFSVLLGVCNRHTWQTFRKIKIY